MRAAEPPGTQGSTSPKPIRALQPHRMANRGKGGVEAEQRRCRPPCQPQDQALATSSAGKASPAVGTVHLGKVVRDLGKSLALRGPLSTFTYKYLPR